MTFLFIGVTFQRWGRQCLERRDRRRQDKESREIVQSIRDILSRQENAGVIETPGFIERGVATAEHLP